MSNKNDSGVSFWQVAFGALAGAALTAAAFSACQSEEPVRAGPSRQHHSPSRRQRESASSVQGLERVSPPESREEVDLCPVCMDHGRNVILIPCGHRFCNVCTVELKKLDNECPLCKMQITDATLYY